MIRRLAVALLLASAPTAAHRLDEYLQSALISVEKSHVQVRMYLTPGVAVFPAVWAGLDTNGDGRLSATEQRTYAGQVLREISLTVDGDRLPLRLVSTDFADAASLQEGRGEIHLELLAALPPGHATRRLIFENHHQPRLSTYLVNCLVPSDPRLRVVSQKRNYPQSVYELDFTDSEPANWSSAALWAGSASLLLLLIPLAFVRRGA